MKFNHLLVVLFAAVSSFCYSSPELLQTRKDLKQFLVLSDHCNQSCQATSNQAAFNAFRKIKLFKLNHRKYFKDLDTLDWPATKRLASDAAQLLKSTLASTTKMDVKTMENLALAEAMQLFTRAMPNLLHPTSTPIFLRRLLLLTVVEVVFTMTNYMVLTKDSSGAPAATITPLSSANAPANLPAVTVDEVPPQKMLPSPLDRIKSLQGFKGSDFAKMVGLALAKTAVVGAVNEFSPKGISSYVHRFCEAVIPKLFAAIVFCLWVNKDLTKMQAFGKAMSVLNPIILQKAFLHSSHVMYKPMEIISYAFPFVYGPTVKSGGAMSEGLGGKISKLTNMAMDGGFAALIFNVIPQAMEKVLPKRNMPLNPSHRRKMIKNAVREICDSALRGWNSAAGLSA